MHHHEFGPMQRHRPQHLAPHSMFTNIFVNRPRRVDVESERQKINFESIKTSLAYKPTTTFVEGNVKALLIGIDYTGTQHELSGCVNDVHAMIDTLRQIDFPITESSVLVDDEHVANVTALPTRENIIKYISWLVKDAQSGDTLFFHYSGHGAQTKALERDEEFDHCIIPLDYETEGSLLADDLFKMLVEPLSEGVRLTCVLDCCYSATMLDLPFGFVSNKRASDVGNSMTHFMKKLRNSNFSKGDVVVFSGCEDDPSSVDVQNVSSFSNGETGAGGAATQAFIWALANTAGLDYLSILLKARDLLKEKEFTQVPQLSSSKPLDLDRTFSLFGTVAANEEQLQRHVPEKFRCPPPPPRGRRRGGAEQGFGLGPMTKFRRSGRLCGPSHGGMSPRCMGSGGRMDDGGDYSNESESSGDDERGLGNDGRNLCGPEFDRDGRIVTSSPDFVQGDRMGEGIAVE
ncbi:putative metacaspase 5 [Leptomonas seymouri]|uniref:Putative metacaspase 5 n=1 Tax=Leptomonas seymouri TaxID=5684 RepID=A0A0N1HW49_LEPSE|nr:putative metacaspase 5 [Leptomonas seymouri]|eukprot:KPI86194.1 putative metacaspase 5 [Leptomonas seymouri]